MDEQPDWRLRATGHEHIFLIHPATGGKFCEVCHLTPDEILEAVAPDDDGTVEGTLEAMRVILDSYKPETEAKGE